ncbi:deoxynucleoside monophosphate kinase [Microbacterium phage Honk]|uniref:Deoxynucleoside monophosphate kinase n=1 Tax=Microbacterium phage Honk TaxID=2836095 RepID=A0A8F3IKA2_9CAUD|nr:deoxynucleoside monophosphate kinase [Microbacterium phage Honk]
MTALPLFGLVGIKRSGKDSIADTLVGEYGYKRAAFATPLRAFTEAADPIVGHELDGPYRVRAVHYTEAIDGLGYELAKERYPEVRRILQTLGTEGMRETLGKEHGLDELLGGVSPWVALAELRITKALDYVRLVPDERTAYLRNEHHWRELLAFTDVRFANEAELIRSFGGKLIRVIRPGLAADDLHKSETELDGIEVDHELVNDGTLDDLARGVRAILSNY